LYEGYYDIELKDETGNAQALEKDVAHFWQPVMDALLGNNKDDSHTTGWHLHRRGLLISMKHSNKSPWPKAPETSLASQFLKRMGSSIGGAGTEKLSCIHVLIPLVSIPSNKREKYGLASWTLDAGSILLADCSAYHEGFARALRDSNHDGFPILYLTYTQRRSELPDVPSADENADQVKTMAAWMEKKALLLPESVVRITQNKGFLLPASVKSRRCLELVLNQTPRHRAPGTVPEKEALNQTPRYRAPGKAPKKDVLNQTPRHRAPGTVPKKDVLNQTPRHRAPGTVPKKDVLNQTPRHRAPGMVRKKDAIPGIEPHQTLALGMAPEQDALPGMVPDDHFVHGMLLD